MFWRFYSPRKFQEVSAAYKRLTTNVGDGDDEIDDSEFMNIVCIFPIIFHEVLFVYILQL